MVSAVLAEFSPDRFVAYGYSSNTDMRCTVLLTYCEFAAGIRCLASLIVSYDELAVDSVVLVAAVQLAIEL